MPKSSTPSFITTIPLIVASQSETELLSRFQAGRQLYNALLNEAMVRMKLVRKSDLYQFARKLPKLPKNKLRNEAFKVAYQQYRYSEYDLQAYASVVANQAKWIADKVDSNTQQKLATRAFKASSRVILGFAKKVRYKVPAQFKSMEGKSNKQGIRWAEDKFIWGKLKLEPIIDLDNPVTMHGLTSKIKYVRILFKFVNGKRRWFAQLINEGIPFQKPANFTTDGVVGLDLNVSNIAYVSDNEAGLLPFAEGVPTFQKEISRIQSKMQRSQRLANPDNYEPDFIGRKGRKQVVKKGKNKKRCASVGFPTGRVTRPVDHESATRQGRFRWNRSKRYQKLRAKKRELERRKSEYAKSQNRKLVNDILRHGNQIKTENVSVKGWQKLYGKAIAAKSPGFFQSELKRKAEGAGGSFYEFSTRTTALSQTHLTGDRIKKSLSERVHYDLTGIVMHRDIFSAFLSRHIIDSQLSLLDAQLEYPGLEQVLLGAWQCYDKKSANRVSIAESRLSQSPVEQIPS